MENKKLGPNGLGRAADGAPGDGEEDGHDEGCSDSESLESSSMCSSFMSDDDSSHSVSDLGSSFNNSTSHSSGMAMTNAILGMPSAPTYPDGEYEDNKADMIAKLMANHADFVTSSLVDRSNLIKSVTWLSHHVPGCVLKSLYESIMRARKKRAKLERQQQRKTHNSGHKTKSQSQSPPPRHSFNPSILFQGKAGSLSPNPPFIREEILPLTKDHNSALLFVDISGFTKISTMLDVESLSSAINSYFQMIVNEITFHGGDILKFAGDALFAEWRVSHHKTHHDLGHCVKLAASCGAAIVANCSDYAVLSKPIGFTLSSRRTSLVSRRDSTVDSTRSSVLSTQSARSTVSEGSTEGGTKNQPQIPRRASAERTLRASMSSEAATLNVKCAVGIGHIVGIHVGDDISRREYLILGEPIGQVAKAESAASQGEVFASPEATELLASLVHVKGDWESAVKDGRPVLIADRNAQYFEAKRRRMSHRESSMSCGAGAALSSCDELDTEELQWLKRTISLYVHPVVVNDENENAIAMRRTSDQNRHLAEAELRNVYTCFITPLIDCKLTGDKREDQKLFTQLNDIMNITTREIDRVQGHLRQFILDDKGLVLICTFGLRGSTFPNMIAQRALPFSLSIHKSLAEELGVKSKVGATFGKVYCGVVGGLERHEFAALGPSVNLAARLMASKSNPGILVDKNVRLLTSQVFFKPLPAVKAKGYEELVPIYEPIKNTPENQWGKAKKNFVGRTKEVKKIMNVAKDMVLHSTVSKLIFINAMSGTGKSTLMVQAIEYVRSMVKKMHKRIVVTHNVSHDGDSRVPFSLFRSIFRDVLEQVRQEDEESQASMARRNSIADTTDFSIEGQWETLSIHTASSKNSTMSTEITRFRYICQELNAPPEFVDVVGKRFLGMRDRNKDISASKAKPPNPEKIISFMADAFLRCTKHASIVLLALDDVQWMDDMSWKVVQTIYERGENVLALCGSRPPSTNPLTIDPNFWSDLHDQFQTEGRFSELSLAPFSETDVQELIATALDLREDEIDSSFRRNVFSTTGGMPHYLTGLLDTIKRNNLTLRLDNGLVGMKASDGESKLGFGSIGELLLVRIDSLESSVRTVLHLSAVLGTEFTLLDAALAYEEMFSIEESRQLETATALRACFDVAIEEGIIEQSFAFSQDDAHEELNEEDNLCHSLGNIMISLKGRKAHPFYMENRRLCFTHDSWKSAILSVLLDERKQEMHEHVARTLERDLDEEAHNEGDFTKQIRVLKHWKSSGNFAKAAQHGLNVGGELMLLGLNSQAILLFDDVMDILKDMTGDGLEVSHHGGISAAVLDAIDAPELEHLIKLNIAKGKAFSTLGRGEDGAEAFQSALDILQNSPCADEEEFDRSVSFPIFSGLFVVLKMGAIEQDEECSYEKELCKKFVEQARLNGDPVHYGRALAMEAETLGRLGNFEQALEVVARIKTIYNIETQHSAICKAYGSDRVAQAFTNSINFNNALGRTQASLEMCDHIVEEIVPRSDPKNIHNTCCLLYAVIVFLKENGLALKARDVFQARVVEMFEEHFGPGGNTFSKPLFKPIIMLLELQGGEEMEDKKIDEYSDWILDKDIPDQRLKSCELAWASLSASPFALLGEVCFELSKRHKDVKIQTRLMEKAIGLMEQSVEKTAKLPYANSYAKKKLVDILSFQSER